MHFGGRNTFEAKGHTIAPQSLRLGENGELVITGHTLVRILADSLSRNGRADIVDQIEPPIRDRRIGPFESLANRLTDRIIGRPDLTEYRINDPEVAGLAVDAIAKAIMPDHILFPIPFRFTREGYLSVALHEFREQGVNLSPDPQV